MRREKSIWHLRLLGGQLESELLVLTGAIEPAAARTPTAPVSAGIIDTARLLLRQTSRVLSRYPGAGGALQLRMPPNCAELAITLRLAHGSLVQFRMRMEEIDEEFAEDRE